MKPEDEAKIREIALSLLNNRRIGECSPPEIIVTYRKHEDYEKLTQQIAELTEQLYRSKHEAAKLSLYAEENFRLYDQLRQAYQDMQRAGLDVSYITSVKPRNRLR